MSEDINYNKIGDEMFQTYFDTYYNTDNHTTAQENANGILGDLWYEELEPNNIKIVINKIGNRLKNCENDMGYEISEEFAVPMHSWISNCLFEAQEIHGKKDFVELDKFINSELVNYLIEYKKLQNKKNNLLEQASVNVKKEIQSIIQGVKQNPQNADIVAKKLAALNDAADKIIAASNKATECKELEKKCEKIISELEESMEKIKTKDEQKN